MNFILDKIRVQLENRGSKDPLFRRLLRIQRCRDYMYCSKGTKQKEVKVSERKEMKWTRDKETFYLNKLFGQSKAIEEVLGLVGNPGSTSVSGISNVKVDNKYLLESKVIPKLKSKVQKPRVPTRVKSKPVFPKKPSDNLKFFRKLQKKLEEQCNPESGQRVNFLKNLEGKEWERKSSGDGELKNLLHIEESSELTRYKQWEAQLLRK
jgi:hypothetical protein